jgi:hypothetical protein
MSIIEVHNEIDNIAIDTRTCSTGGIGCVLSTIYDDVTVKRTTIVSNEKQQRVKPANLMTHMTDLPVQYTHVCEASESSIIHADYWACSCPDEPAAHNKYTHKLQKFPCVAQFWESFGYGDWQTGIRTQAKDLKVNLGQDLAEYRQTADSFKALSRSMVNAWHIYKGRRRRRRITPCAIPAAKLIYSFGVAPLVGTLFDATEKLRSTLDDPTFIKLMQSAMWSGSINRTVGSHDVRGKQSRSSRAEVWLRYNRGAFSHFTMGNPAEIAWELVPYSWLIDGVIDIGTSLSALDALSSVSGIYGTVTHKDKATASALISEPSDYWTVLYRLPGKLSYKAHTRDAISSIPMPDLPQWRPSASWHKLSNAVAALWQIRKC